MAAGDGNTLVKSLLALTMSLPDAGEGLVTNSWKSSLRIGSASLAILAAKRTLLRRTIRDACRDPDWYNLTFLRHVYGKPKARWQSLPEMVSSSRLIDLSSAHVASRPYSAWGRAFLSMTNAASAVPRLLDSVVRRPLTACAFDSASLTCSVEVRR